jgi:hypothetical protein
LRLDAVYPVACRLSTSGPADQWCILTCQTDVQANFRRFGSYGDAILQSAKPGDHPDFQSPLYELIVDPEAARTLASTLPQTSLIRADQVIQ